MKIHEVWIFPNDLAHVVMRCCMPNVPRQYQAMIELKVLAATCQICRREKDVGHAGPVKILSQVTCTTSSKSKIKKSKNKKGAMHSDDTHIPLRNLQSKVNSANAISASHHCGAS